LGSLRLCGKSFLSFRVNACEVAIPGQRTRPFELVQERDFSSHAKNTGGIYQVIKLMSEIFWLDEANIASLLD
jgi:hypothetical protein